MPLDVLGRTRYTDGASERVLRRKVRVILAASVVLGIDGCNY